MAAFTLVMLRHGESVFNAENRFSGWYDADLAESGVEEAKLGGQVSSSNYNIVVVCHVI